MSATAIPAPPVTEASGLAFHRFADNTDALRATQARLSQRRCELDAAEFVFARDGSLSARTDDRWWSSCSVPSLTAESALKALELQGGVGCFIDPPHAASLRVALDRIRPEQAIVAIVPDLGDLTLMLHCGDFAHDIRAHRLWFAAGSEWATELGTLLDAMPGLAIPSQFIRLPGAEEGKNQEIIRAAQAVMSDVTTRRGMRIRELGKLRQCRPSERLCVISPSRFRLWNDLGNALLGATRELADRAVHFDPDDLAHNSPLALAQVLHTCGAVLAANTGRADLPAEIVPADARWISWLTAPRVPPFCPGSPRDMLLCADEALLRQAVQSGWPDANVRLARWPRVVRGTRPQPARPALGIFADTHSLQRPSDLNDYSSHGLLWDMIRQELTDDPFRVGTDVAAYLRQRMRRIEIPGENFPAARFIDRLIVPAYQQSIARLLTRAGLPLFIHGQGWDAIDDLRSAHAGTVRDRAQFDSAIASVTAIVNVWPVEWAHPCTRAGVPVVGIQRSREALLLAARRAVAGTFDPLPPDSPALDSSLIRVLLESC